MTGYIVSVFPFRNRVSSKEAFEGLELGEGKLSRPVLRGPGGRKAVWLLGSEVPATIACVLTSSNLVSWLRNLIAYQRARKHGGDRTFARFERLLAEIRFRGVDHRTVTTDKDRRKFQSLRCTTAR